MKNKLHNAVLKHFWENIIIELMKKNELLDNSDSGINKYEFFHYQNYLGDDTPNIDNAIKIDAYNIKSKYHSPVVQVVSIFYTVNDKIFQYYLYGTNEILLIITDCISDYQQRIKMDSSLNSTTIFNYELIMGTSLMNSLLDYSVLKCINDSIINLECKEQYHITIDFRNVDSFEFVESTVLFIKNNI